MTDDVTRRTVLAGGAALGLAGRAQAATADATRPAIAVGTVTEIVPRRAPTDGPLAKGPPVAGVLVSNGREVVRTDAQGHYSLPVAPGQSIFVVKPAGFGLPIDAATNLVRFSYVYDPDGTPAALGFRYAGLAPTGPLPASLDFELSRVAEPARFDVVLVTDPQPESTAEIEYVRDAVVCGLVGAKAAFGMTCGDLMFDDLSMFDRFNRIFGAIGLPWWAIGGNHDLDYEAPNAARSRDSWKRVFGAPYYAHEHAGALFVMLDNVDYLGAGTGKPGSEEQGAYRGHFPDAQLAFVKNLLAATPKERLIVLALPHPAAHLPRPEGPGQQHGQCR